MLIALSSLKGSPGVTQLAMSLTALWPGTTPAVLIECDPVGGTIAARYGLPVSPSLTNLAAAGFHDPTPELIGAHSQALQGGLPVVVAPSDPFGTAAAIDDLAQSNGLFQRLQADRDRVGIADCGRLDIHRVSPVFAVADAVALVAYATPESLALAGRATQLLRDVNPRLVLVLRGSGYSTREVEQALSVRALQIPDSTGGWPLGRAQRGAYARAAMAIAQDMDALALRLLPAAVTR